MEIEKERLRRFFRDPLRVSGGLAVFFLVAPGSFAGFTLLLAHAGLTGASFQVPASIHAAAQLMGFFILLIWGFLVHGFPGILGSRHETTQGVTARLTVVGAAVLALWLSAAFGLPAWTLDGALVLGAAASVDITWRFGQTLRFAGRRRRRTPLPFLYLGLLVVPLYWGALFLQLRGGARLPAADLLLLGAVIPIILSMGYRMLPSLGGFRQPRQRAFVAAAWVWGIGLLAWTGEFFLPLDGYWARGLFAIAAMLFFFSMRMGEPLREGRKRAGDATDRPLRGFVRLGYAWLVVGTMVGFLNSLGALPGIGYYWDDAGRHALALGFALFVTAGITQRTFPTFLRGRAVSQRVAWATCGMLVAGLGLRMFSEPFLPASQPAVGLSAFMLYTGILMYGWNLVYGMVPGRSGEHPESVQGGRRVRTM